MKDCGCILCTAENEKRIEVGLHLRPKSEEERQWHAQWLKKHPAFASPQAMEDCRKQRELGKTCVGCDCLPQVREMT